MKKIIRKWAFRLGVTILFIFALLIILILNPGISYARKTMHDNLRIFHTDEYDKKLDTRLDEAISLIRNSPYYQSRMKLDICLDDGSSYPKLIRKLMGPAFGRGFYNKVVIMGKANPSENIVELNGYRWNLSQLLAHEMMHCYQFKKRGLWKSKPFARIPNWKWEGYPEYVARKNPDQLDLKKNISRLLDTEKKDTNGWILFEDGTGTAISYYKYWLLMQHCIDIKKMSYDNVLETKLDEISLMEEMMNWFKK